MDGDREERTRKRAFEIWERAGRSGDPNAHWFQAEQELAAESASCESPHSLPEDWLAAIDSAVQKLAREAKVRRARLRR
jgi:hypothetical protein